MIAYGAIAANVFALKIEISALAGSSRIVDEVNRLARIVTPRRRAFASHRDRCALQGLPRPAAAAHRGTYARRRRYGGDSRIRPGRWPKSSSTS